MKDYDTKVLEGVYDNINGVPPTPLILLKEDFDPAQRIILEGIVDSLGGSNNPTAVDTARKLIGLVIREIPACGDTPNCLRGLNNRASIIIKNVERLGGPMISRLLSQYGDLSPVSKAKVIYQILSI